MHNIWCIKSTTLWEFFSLSKQSTCFPKISVSSPMYLPSMPSFLYICSPYDMVAHVINPWVQVVQTSCKLSSKTPFFVKKKLKNKKNLTNYGYSALSTCQAFSQKMNKNKSVTSRKTSDNFVANDKNLSFRAKSEFWKICIHHFKLVSFPILRLLWLLAGDISNCDF